MQTNPRPLPLLLALACSLVAVSVCPAPAQSPTGPWSAHAIFDQPYVFQQLSEVMPRGLQAGRMGRVDQMEVIMDSLVARLPDHPVPRYNQACAKARLGKSEEALDALEQAVTLGLTNADEFARDPDLASIRRLPRFDQILQQAKTATPFRPRLPAAAPRGLKDGVAPVQEANTAWDPRRGLLLSLFEFPDKPAPIDDVVNGDGTARDLVRQWYREGSAAGNHRDLYDNRDGDHSNLKYDRFPQLARVEYSAAARARKLHWGPQTRILFNAVTIGNASVAATGNKQWGSMARHTYAVPRSMAVLHTQYRANHLYLYPEHKDHDIGHNGVNGGYGDVFCVNTPYLLISQGSSGSDKVFLDALALCLAGFQPAVKQQLADKGLLMPTLQMILRRCNQPVKSARDYLSGIAHPTAFDGKRLNPERMVKLAHAITPDTLPPLAALTVIEEDTPRPGIDYFHHTPSEVICTTPHAIGRVARSTAYTRRMVVSAEDSLDVNDRPLTYHWRILRGDPKRIQINPLNESRSTVELLISYHERFPVRKGSALESNRVDIGAFVHNGAHYSAPAFVSVFYFDNEERVYDDRQRIVSVRYSGGTTSGNYVDPRIDAPKDWRDEYHYDNGMLTGWTRTLDDGQIFEFTPAGRVIAERDQNGALVKTLQAVYPGVPTPDGRTILAQATVEPRRPVGPRIQP